MVYTTKAGRRDVTAAAECDEFELQVRDLEHTLTFSMKSIMELHHQAAYFKTAALMLAAICADTTRIDPDGFKSSLDKSRTDCWFEWATQMAEMEIKAADETGRIERGGSNADEA